VPDLTHKQEQVLSSPARKELHDRLKELGGSHSLGELSQEFKIDLAGLHYHLGVLEEAGLVESELNPMRRYRAVEQ
jgi:DNA-binding transcriptional ArsR family regulator